MKSLKQKDYIWNTFGVFLQNAISPILLVVVTRINGIEESGVYSFAFSVAVIFWAIAVWGGRTYQVSDISEKFKKKTYIAARLVLSALVIIGSYLFCILNGYDQIKTAILMSLVLTKVVEAIADVYYGVMQTSKKLYRSGQIMVAKYIIASVGFLLVDTITHNLLLSCLAFLSVTCLFLVCVDIPYARLLEPNIRGRVISASITQEALKVTAILTPVFVVSLFAMLSLNIPRYFIDTYHPDEIGYFGILAMPVTLVVLLMTFILQPNVVELAKLFVEKRLREFSSFVIKICVITLMLGVFILVITAWIGVPILELVFGINFSQYYIALQIIVLAATVNALVGIMINILIIMRIFTPQLITLAGTNIVLVVLSLSIIPYNGLTGAVLLFLMINIIQLLILTLIYGIAIRK